jgi:hypothetical protein
MDAKTLIVSKEEANVLYREYREALRTHRDQYLHDLKTVYGHMKHGRAVLDVWQAFRDSGLDANGDPKIAICRSDAARCTLRKSPDGGARFMAVDGWKALKEDVSLPAGSFTWSRGEPTYQGGPRVILREKLATVVPVVPAKFLPKTGLNNFYTLWEVEKWDLVTPPVDPMLLRRVSPNMFVVMATWDLTEIERAVLRGRIA